MKNRYDVIVIGGGPAGMAAAIAAHENGAQDIIILERRFELGGILNQCIHSGFGLHRFGEELTGPEYAHRFMEMIKEYHIEAACDTSVVKILPGNRVLIISPHSGIKIILGKAVVMATGCRERNRGGLGISGTRPAGIFTAGTAQQFINQYGYLPGKEVVILGSGDIGLIMARRLTLEGALVKGVIEVKSFPGGLKRNIVQCLDDFNIPLLLNHSVIEIHGRKRVTGVTVARVDDTGNPIVDSVYDIPCDTIVLSVGLFPDHKLPLNTGIKIDHHTGGPVVNQWMETSIPGIFACGDGVYVHDLVDDVTAEGGIAGCHAALFAKDPWVFEYAMAAVTPGEGVRFCIPQIISSNGDENFQIFLRIKEKFSHGQLVVNQDGKKIFSIPKAYALPGEMISIRLPKENFIPQKDNASLLTISMIEREENK